MIQFDVKVEYRDGTTIALVADQYAVSQWEQWAAKNGLHPDPSNAGALMNTQLRVMAWAEAQRDATTKQSFTVWERTVANVVVGDVSGADPTRPPTSGG